MTCGEKLVSSHSKGEAGASLFLVCSIFRVIRPPIREVIRGAGLGGPGDRPRRTGRREGISIRVACNFAARQSHPGNPSTRRRPHARGARRPVESSKLRPAAAEIEDRPLLRPVDRAGAPENIAGRIMWRAPSRGYSLSIGYPPSSGPDFSSTIPVTSLLDASTCRIYTALPFRENLQGSLATLTRSTECRQNLTAAQTESEFDIKMTMLISAERQGQGLVRVAKR